MKKKSLDLQWENLKKLLPSLQKNISLRDYTTFKIGGLAKYFLVAKTKKEIIKALKVARRAKVPVFILGGGSNVLVADKGFEGLVIKIQNSKFKIQNQNSKFKVYCEAGMPLTKLALETAKIGASGLEWAVGIPGTIGGAIYGNAGAFGKSMADVVKEVEVFDLKKLDLKTFKKKDCLFDYRDSVFKKKKNFVILSAILILGKERKKVIEKKIKEFLDYRKKTQPLNFPSAGSIFKNPKNFPAGFLIEKCGLKGKKLGGVEISRKHANFIINLGNGKAEEVRKLIALMKKKVKEKFKIALKEEIEFLGFKQ